MGVFVLVAAIVAATLLVGFWDSLNEWVKKFIERVGKNVKDSVKVFIKKMREAYVEIVKTWKKEGNKWFEMTERREVSENEVPEEIRAKAEKAEKREVDITPEYQKELAKLENR